MLIKTLLNAGIITDRTRSFYGMYVDMNELKAEGDRMVGDDIAEEGIKFLQAVNFGANAQGDQTRGGVSGDGQVRTQRPFEIRSRFVLMLPP